MMVRGKEVGKIKILSLGALWQDSFSHMNDISYS